MRSKGLGLPRASHYSEIALAGSRRLRYTLAAAPVLFVHVVATEIKIGKIITSNLHGSVTHNKSTTEGVSCGVISRQGTPRQHKTKAVVAKKTLPPTR